CASVRPGTDYRQLHVDAHLALMGILREFGVLKVSPEAALASGVSAAFFPHGLGHPLGLQVHDVAGFAASDRGGTIDRPAGHPYLPRTRVREPGMVVTIEPGLYSTDMLLAAVKARGHADAVAWRGSTSSVPMAASASRTTCCAPATRRRTSPAPRSPPELAAGGESEGPACAGPSSFHPSAQFGMSVLITCSRYSSNSSWVIFGCCGRSCRKPT